MSWYRTGTVNVTNNSDIVTGVGTDWLNAAREGDVFQGPDMVSYEIIQLINAGSLRCRPAYRGATAAGQSYALIPTRSRDVETATSIATLVSNYQGVRDNAGTGKFATGSAGVPSLRGSADEDTGINLPGGNSLQLIAGGAVQMEVSASGTASGPVVVSSNKDVTAGKMLVVGHLGHGGNAPGIGDTIDEPRPGGSITMMWAGDPKRPAGVPLEASATLSTYAGYHGDWLNQLLIADGIGDAYIRSIKADKSAQTHWAKLVTALNIGQLYAANQAGASSVGAFAFLLNVSGAPMGPAVETVGSNLRYSGASSAAGPAPVGTWRCMGQCANNEASVFLRVY